MIILASSIILTLNNSGIINKANEAVDKTDLAQVKNLATLKWSEAYLNNEENIAKYVIEGLQDEGIITDKFDITVTEFGVDVELKEEVPAKWTENVVAMQDGVPIPKGFVASKASGENTKLGGLVIYEGTEAVTDANVQLARRTRNQYVWVPVSKEDFTKKFIRQIFDETPMFEDEETVLSNELGVEYWEMVVDTTINMPLIEQNSTYISPATLNEVQEMYESVKEYEGFYIARYEAGIDEQRTNNNHKDEDGNVLYPSKVYSVMGKLPYTYIPWSDSSVISDDASGAIGVARSIYPVTNTEYGVVSTLPYGVQWDATLQWWLDTGAVDDLMDSTEYGNVENHEILSKDELNEDARVSVIDSSTNEWGAYVSKDNVQYPK